MNERAARKIRETSGPTVLDVGDIADGELVSRDGDELKGAGIAPPKAQRFSASGASWQHYTIPTGHKNLAMDLVGGGSGGGNGQSGAEGTGRRGGQGGSSGNHTVWSGRVPDGVTQLSVFVGRGGAGGGGLGGNGAAGESSIVSVSDSSATDKIICKSGTNVATGGFSGANNGTGGGNAESDWNGSCRFSGWGQFASRGGQGGGNGGNGNVGASITPSPQLERTGGAGGGARSAGGTSFAGGGISASGDMAAVSGGTVEGGAGGHGAATTFPATWTGGAGGAGGDTTGGNGGDGALGCGGGGGGAGVTGGTGGDGGDGWVEIRTW